MPMSWQEAVAVASFAWSVWLLAENRPLGWWIGLIGSVMYAWVFYEARLYGEILIQIFFIVTSLYGIWAWMHGGEEKREKPVERANKRQMVLAGAVGLTCWAGCYVALVKLQGAAPFWDALTTVVSFVAQVFMMLRYVESWPLWIFVDIIYVPLYASRGLYLTSALYAVFLWMAWRGLKNFQRAWEDRQRQNA